MKRLSIIVLACLCLGAAPPSPTASPVPTITLSDGSVVTAAAIEARIAELTEQRNTLAGQVIDLTDQLHKIQQAVNQAQSKK